MSLKRRLGELLPVPTADRPEAEVEPACTDRRTVTKAVAAAGVALAALPAMARPLRAEDEPAADADGEPAAPREGDLPRQWGMAIDLDLCTACGGCAVACKTENNVPSMGPGEENDDMRIEWMALLPAEEGEDAFGYASSTLPLPCLHCEDPPCVSVCPVGATHQTEDGITAQIWDRCIGCRYCQVACPYSRRYFTWSQPNWPESYRSFLNPDVATRPAGVVEKCTMCYPRVRDTREVARIEGRLVEDDDVQSLPACAETCPANAIVFGDLLDRDSRVSRLSRSPRVFRLLAELGTQPKVFYLGRDRRGLTT